MHRQIITRQDEEETMFRRANATTLLFQFQDEPPPHWHLAMHQRGATHAVVIDRLVWVKFTTHRQAYACWHTHHIPPGGIHLPIAAPTHSGDREFLPEMHAMIERMGIPLSSVRVYDMTRM